MCCYAYVILRFPMAIDQVRDKEIAKRWHLAFPYCDCILLLHVAIAYCNRTLQLYVANVSIKVGSVGGRQLQCRMDVSQHWNQGGGKNEEDEKTIVIIYKTVLVAWQVRRLLDASGAIVGCNCIRFRWHPSSCIRDSISIRALFPTG